MKYPLSILQPKELEVLLKMFNLEKKDNKIETLEQRLSKLLLPGKGFLQSSIDYPEFLDRIAKKNSVCRFFRYKEQPERSNKGLNQNYIKKTAKTLINWHSF